jgi:hypothetical protein
MGRPRKPDSLAPEEKLFLEAYVNQCNFDTFEAIQVSGIPYLNKQSAQQKAHNIINKPIAQAYIEAAIKTKQVKFCITEEEILKGIYGEAHYFGEGASHAARIQAWVQIGKHFGMFSDKKQEQVGPSVTYNIINYAEPIDKIKTEAIKAIEQIPEEVIEESLEEPIVKPHTFKIEVKEYSDE